MTRSLVAAVVLAASAAGVAAAYPPGPPVGVPECEVWWEDTAFTHNIDGVPQPQQPSSVWCDY
ncbi:MAG TPA: hypothetical protein VF519_05695 [Mycobacteriales bacterium]